MKERLGRSCRGDGVIIAIASLALLFCMQSVAANHAYQWVDGAWNAQIADVFAKTGEYAVIYPHKEAFFVPITTGQTVLLPVALVYRIFGVSPGTSAAVPLAYMGAAVVLLLVVLRRAFLSAGFGAVSAGAASALCAAVCFFFYSLYGRYAFQVLGEGAALMFFLLAALLLSRYARTKSRMSAMLCGAMLSCALITKTVAVCGLLVFALLMVLECVVTRRYPLSLLMWLFFGFAAAFCALEVLKFIQLGGGIGAYFTWWKKTVSYSFGLSSESALEASLSVRLLGNVQAAAELFAAGQVPALFAMLLIAPVCYLLSAGARLTGRKDPFADSDRFSLLALGLCGDGFVVASLLFTSSSMFIERRTLLHGVFFLVFVLAMAIELIRFAYRNRRAVSIASAVICAYAALACTPRAGQGVLAFARYDTGEDAQRARDVYAFSQAVSELDDARFYAYGWQFAAETMLLNGLTMYNLQDLPPEYDAAQNHYLLVESYPIGYDLSADYSLTPVWQLRPGEETYSIYRIEPADTKE